VGVRQFGEKGRRCTGVALLAVRESERDREREVRREREREREFVEEAEDVPVSPCWRCM